MMVKHLLRGLWAPALALSLPVLGYQAGFADEPAQPEQPAAAASGGDQATPSPSAPADTSPAGGQESAPSVPAATADSGTSSEGQPSATPESQPKLEDPGAKIEANAEAAKSGDAAKAEDAAKVDAAAKTEADKAEGDKAARTAEGRAGAENNQRRANDQQKADRNAGRGQADRADGRRDNAERRTTNFRPDRPNQEDQLDDRRSDDRNANDRGDRDNRDRDGRDRDDRRGSRNNFGLFFSIGGNGLAIDRLDRSSPFYRAGVRRGDTLVSVNGHRLSRDEDFHRWLSGTPDERVVVVVLRDGRQTTYYVEPEWLVEDRSDQRDSGYDTRGEAYLGVVLDERRADGAFVQDVREGSPAEQAGLQQGDQILRLNGRAVRSPDHLTQIVNQMQPGDKVDIEFARGRSQSVTVELGQRQTSRRFDYDDDVRGSDDDADVRYRDNRNVDGQYRGEVIIQEGDRRQDGREIRNDDRDNQNRRGLGRVLRPFRD